MELLFTTLLCIVVIFQEVSSEVDAVDHPIDWKDENGHNINDGFHNLVTIPDCQENNFLDQISDLNFRIDFPVHDGEIAYDHIFCNGGRSIKLYLHDPSHGGDFDTHNGHDGVNTDKQRLELKPSNEWRSEKGTTFIYAHWFKLDKDIDAGTRFFHIFQIKTSDAKDGHPILTISMKKSDGLYFDYHEENGADYKYRTQLLPLSEVGDHWFQVILVADYDYKGDAKLWFKDQDGTIVKYVHYDDIQMWYHDEDGHSHTGPAYSKYGLYRGVTEDLKYAAIELQNVQIWKK